MLKVSKINYPITFRFTDPRDSITFNSRYSKGVWHSGLESTFGVDAFVKKHNQLNKDNNPDFDYYYEMSEHKIDNEKYFIDKGMIVDGNLNLNGDAFTASKFTLDYRICKVEEMPVSATLKGIQDCNGEWHEVTFKPVRFEVHDDIITLLSGYAGWPYGAEINIKRGTNVKFS